MEESLLKTKIWLKNNYWLIFINKNKYYGRKRSNYKSF